MDTMNDRAMVDNDSNGIGEGLRRSPFLPRMWEGLIWEDFTGWLCPKRISALTMVDWILISHSKCSRLCDGQTPSGGLRWLTVIG